MARMWIGVLALACACGPERGEAEVDCDVDAVVPLLVTASDERASLVGRAGETWVFGVTTYPMDVADILASDGLWPTPIDTHFVAVDGCGAEPRSIAEGFDSIAAPPSAQWPWLARLYRDGATAGVFRIDPIGGAEPERIGSDPEARILWTTDGVVVFDGTSADPSTLVHVAFDADGGLQRRTLREDVKRLASSAGTDRVHERIAFIDTEDQLFVFDVATREERLVRVATDSATAYDAQSRALFICGGPGEPCHFIDADGTLDIELLESEGVGYVSTVSSSDFVASMRPLGATTGESQIVWMPELREFRGPGRWESQGRSEDGAIRMLQGPDAIYRLDADTDEPVFVRQGRGYATVFGDRIWMLHGVDDGPTVSSRPSKLRFVRMLMDGSNVEDLLGDEVTHMMQLDRDRWIYTTELDARDLGDLEAVDLATGERETLLDSVMPQAIPSRTSAFVDDDPNDALVGRIAPDDPEGNGVWWVHRERLFGE